MPTTLTSDQLLAMFINLSQTEKDAFLAAIQAGTTIADVASGGGPVEIMGTPHAGTYFEVAAVDQVELRAGQDNVRILMRENDVDNTLELYADQKVEIQSFSGDVEIFSDGAGTHFVDIHANGTNAEVRIQSNSTGKLGFYGTTPVDKQTGVAVSAAGIHAALVALGLIGV